MSTAKHAIHNSHNKTLTKGFWIIALTGFGISFLFFLIISITSYNLLKFDCTYIGFNEFQDIFSFPINIAIVTTSILGFKLALDKFIQNSENVRINNYYRYLDEFKISTNDLLNDIINKKLLFELLPTPLKAYDLKPYESFVQQTISKHFITNTYKLWFGHFHNSDLNIKSDILKELNNLYNTFLSLKENKMYCTPDNLNKIIPFVKKLGLQSLLPNINEEMTIIYVCLLFRICKHILEFDHKEIKNQTKLYERLKI